MHSKNSIHAKRLKAIRPYIKFNYDLRKPLSNYQKRKIKQYFDEFERLTARPHQVYRPRKANHLKTAQQFGQHEKSLPGFKVAFVPNNGEKLKILFDSNNQMTTKSKHVKTSFIQLDLEQLIENPVEHVNAKIDNEAPDAKSFTVKAGDFEIPVGQSRRTIAAYVASLTSKYENEATNNYFGNWLGGINAHEFEQQADFGEYLAEKQKAKSDLKRKRRNQRRKKK